MKSNKHRNNEWVWMLGNKDVALIVRKEIAELWKFKYPFSFRIEKLKRNK